MTPECSIRCEHDLQSEKCTLFNYDNEIFCDVCKRIWLPKESSKRDQCFFNILNGFPNDCKGECWKTEEKRYEVPKDFGTLRPNQNVKVNPDETVSCKPEEKFARKTDEASTPDDAEMFRTQAKQECDHVKRYDQVFAGTSSTTGKKVCYCESAFPERACEHCFLDPEESAERQDIQLCCNCGIKRKRPDDTESYTKAEIDERFDAIAEMCEKMMGWWQTDDERHSNAHSLCRKGQKIEEKQWRKALLDVITQIPLPRYLSSLEMAQNQKRIESLRSKYT